MKQKILIATASFGELDSSILDKLQDSYEFVFNQTGRKLTNEELSKLIVDVEGVGRTFKEAIKDGLLQAISQVNGTQISSETKSMINTFESFP